jgi:streptogramin lyase
VCSGAAHSAAGGTLWSYDGNAVTAFQEQDGGFTLRRATSTTGGHVLVEEHRAFLAQWTGSTPRVHRVTLEDTFPANSASSILPASPGAMTLKGDVLFVANSDSTLDTFGFASTGICAFDVSGNGLSQVGCQAVPGDMVGAADGTFITNQGNTLRAFTGRQDGTLLLVDTLTLPPGMSPRMFALQPFTGNWAEVFNLDTGTLVVRMKGGALHPEQYSLSLYSAGPEYSWANFNNSTKLWRNDPQ